MIFVLTSLISLSNFITLDRKRNFQKPGILLSPTQSLPIYIFHLFTRGLLGCLLGFLPPGQNPAGAMNQSAFTNCVVGSQSNAAFIQNWEMASDSSVIHARKWFFVSADVRGGGTRDEALRTFAWEARVTAFRCHVIHIIEFSVFSQLNAPAAFF